MSIQKEREDFEKFKAKQIGVDYEALKKDLDDCERRFPNNRYAGWNFKSDWELWQSAKSQAVPEGFVLVPKASLKVALSWMDADIDPWQMSSDCFSELYEHKPILEKAMEAQEQSHE